MIHVYPNTAGTQMRLMTVIEAFVMITWLFVWLCDATPHSPPITCYYVRVTAQCAHAWNNLLPDVPQGWAVPAMVLFH